MPFIPVPTAVEWRHMFSLPDNEQMQVVLNTINPSADTDETDGWDAIKDVLLSAWQDNIRGLQHPGVTLDKIVANAQDRQDGAQKIYAVNEAGTGSAAGMLPPQTAGVVTWYTGLRGKSRRGRSYLGGFQEDMSEGVNPAAGVITGLTGWATDLLAGLVPGIDTRLIVVSRYTGGDKNADPPVASQPREEGIFATVDTFAVNPKWRTQRRRAGR